MVSERDWIVIGVAIGLSALALLFLILWFTYYPFRKLFVSATVQIPDERLYPLRVQANPAYVNVESDLPPYHPFATSSFQHETEQYNSPVQTQEPLSDVPSFRSVPVQRKTSLDQFDKHFNGLMGL